MGNGFIGKGVQVATVMRNYSALLNRQSNAANAIHAADTSRLQGLMQMQDVFKGGDGSLGAAVTNMMNAFVDVQAAPSDATGRNVVLTRMSELAARFHAASNMLEEQDYSTAQQLRNNALLVNDKASQVARLNNEISRALATGHQPNDLLDARDQVIREINQYVQTTQVAADDGSISLFVGGSQALVLGINSGQLSVEETKEYPGSQRMALYFSQPGGQQLELTAAMIGGGEIAGLLKFRNDDLAEGRNLLGRLAMTIGHELNLQNQRGLTLNGQQGGALFSLPTTSTGYGNITGYSNIGPGAATTQVMDASQLKPSEYRLIFEGSPVAPVLTRMSDGKVFNATSTPALNMGNLATGFDADGLRFTEPAATLAAAASGNSMLFKPFSTAASEIEALVHNPDELAAASALTANINKNNTGKLQLTQLGANDFTGIPAAQDPVRLTFDGAGQVTYQTYNHLTSTWSAASPPMDYTPGIFETDLSTWSQNTHKVHTTLVGQLAVYMVMWGPLQMAADLPENYAKFDDAMQFIRDMAIDWDDSRYIDAEPGAYITVARKAKGTDNWFVGGKCNENGHKVTVNFDFLDKGRKYECTIYADAKDAHYDTNPKAYVITKKTVKQGDKIKMVEAPGGGFVMSVIAK